MATTGSYLKSIADQLRRFKAQVGDPPVPGVLTANPGPLFPQNRNFGAVTASACGATTLRREASELFAQAT